MVEQHGDHVPFPDGGAMVRNGTVPAPKSESIELNGKPW